MAWPPDPDEFYLPVPGLRAPFQGDIYSDVPFTKAAGGANPGADPSWSATRRYVATLLYPCDMVAEDGVTLVRPQAIALVKPAAGITIPAAWDGAYRVCPLPDLLGDGEMWIADFMKVTNVDRCYLRPELRVRCLSELGWAVFRQRLNLAFTRTWAPVADFAKTGVAAWNETAMETTWVESGRDQLSFQVWLNAEDPPGLPFATRRKALEAGAVAAVRTALEAELENPDG